MALNKLWHVIQYMTQDMSELFHILDATKTKHALGIQEIKHANTDFHYELIQSNLFTQHTLDILLYRGRY
jgi:hypothetical protein